MKAKYKCPSCVEMWNTEEEAQRCCAVHTKEYYERVSSEPPPDIEYYAKKADKGKLQHSLIDPEFIRGLAEVMTYGAEKYSADSWQEVENAKHRYTDAMLRHINAWQRGSKVDEESELHHLLHASVNAMFLMFLERNVDDGKTLKEHYKQMKDNAKGYEEQ